VHFKRQRRTHDRAVGCREILGRLHSPVDFSIRSEKSDKGKPYLPAYSSVVPGATWISDGFHAADHLRRPLAVLLGSRPSMSRYTKNRHRGGCRYVGK
jgi:hypothetical protein